VLNAENLPPSCAVVTKSGNLNFLEHFGPVQACIVTAFFYYKTRICSLSWSVARIILRCTVRAKHQNSTDLFFVIRVVLNPPFSGSEMKRAE